MQNLYVAIESVKDPSVKEALTIIANELKRIHSVHPVTQDTRSIAAAVNSITGKR